MEGGEITAVGSLLQDKKNIRTINKFPVNFESINLSLVSTISKLAIKMLIKIKYRGAKKELFILDYVNFIKCNWF